MRPWTRYTIAAGLAFMGFVASALSLTDPCSNSGDEGRLPLMLAAGVLFGCCAGVLSWHPKIPRYFTFVVAVVTIPVSILAIGFMGVLARASGCSH